MTNDNAPVSLRLRLDKTLLPVAISFAENSGLALGLGKLEALKLTLAVEEVFSYLTDTAETTAESAGVTLEAMGRVYCVEFNIHFNMPKVDFRLLNFAAPYSPGDESSLHQLGLLLASRSVDQFSLSDSPTGEMQLKLVKEKVYPPAAKQKEPACHALAEFHLVPPDIAQIKEAARLLKIHYQPSYFPEAYVLPAKLADMLLSGEIGALLALDSHGDLGGAVFWRFDSKSSLRAYGPYVFCQPDPVPIAQALVEGAINQVAKTQAVSFVCRYPTPELPSEYFEYLGDLDYFTPDGTKRSWPQYYRQLKEDPGAVVWCHPELRDFLQKYCHRLALARDIHLYQAEGEKRPNYSVISTHLDRVQGHATLRPMLDGVDAKENLSRHLAMMKAEGITTIFCNIDLGAVWQSGWVPSLQEIGFAPRLVLPFGGKADLVLFQHLGDPA
jgi:anti-sigma regulatory factor (Ser/Thr protein kinase)